MYKKYNFGFKILSPHPSHISQGIFKSPAVNRVGSNLKTIIEGLTPFLIITATFVWLWR